MCVTWPTDSPDVLLILIHSYWADSSRIRQSD